MVQILFMILKVIGLILVSILGLLLIVLLLVLFVPFRYRIKAKKYKETDALMKVSWLFHAVCVKAFYDKEEFRYQVKLFGVIILSTEKDNKRKKKKDLKKSSHEVMNQEETTNTIKEEPINTIKVEAKTTESVEVKIEKQITEHGEVRIKKETTENVEVKIEKEINTKEDTGKFFHKIGSILRKILHLPSKIKGFFASMKDKIHHIKPIIKSWKNRVGKVKAFIFAEEHRPGYGVIYSIILKLLKHIKPKKLLLVLHIGTGDPSSTGQLLGLVSIIYPMMANNVTVIPYWEETKLEGDLYAKGRIRIFALVRIIIKLLRDKEFKRLIKDFKKVKEEF